MSNTPEIVIIAAIAKGNRVIGRNNGLPWKLPSDLKHFKNMTKKHPIIMGSNTWRSLGEKALPGRPHYVVSRDIETLTVREKDEKLVRPMYTLKAALFAASEYAETKKLDRVFIVGGANIYEQALRFASEMIISEVSNEQSEGGEYAIIGDAYFPQFSAGEWEEVDRTTPEVKSTEIPFDIVTYRRVVV